MTGPGSLSLPAAVEKLLNGVNIHGWDVLHVPKLNALPPDSDQQKPVEQYENRRPQHQVDNDEDVCHVEPLRDCDTRKDGVGVGLGTNEVVVPAPEATPAVHRRLSEDGGPIEVSETARLELCNLPRLGVEEEHRPTRRVPRVLEGDVAVAQVEESHVAVGGLAARLGDERCGSGHHGNVLGPHGRVTHDDIRLLAREHRDLINDLLHPLCGEVRARDTGKGVSGQDERLQDGEPVGINVGAFL